MENFQIISKLGNIYFYSNKIGEGAYSTVYKVKRTVDGNIYALKKVKLMNLSEKEKQNSLNEVRILASVKSNFVISYKEAFFDEKDNTLGIVMEFADNGDLYQKIVEHRKKAIFFEESDIWRVFIQLVKGLKALHDLKILHRDLKSANVFLALNGSAKLGDLNVSKVAKRGLGYTQTGTPYYASPEVWKDHPYDLKSDIWSLGCVLYEMIALKPPFRAENMEGLYNKVINGKFNKIPEKFSFDLTQILRMLIQVSSDSRPTCDEILKHPIIKKRIEYFKAFAGDDTNEDAALLKTIHIPKNLLFLSDKLPKPNYDKTTSVSLKQQAKGYRSYTNNKDIEKTSVIGVVVTEPPLGKIEIDKEDKEKEKEKDKDKGDSEKINNHNENTKNSPLKIRNENTKNSPLKIRKVSPLQIRNVVQSIQNEEEFPQLEILCSKNKKEKRNFENNRILRNQNNENDHLKELYKIYAPYINNPILKYKEIGKPNMPNRVNGGIYYKNIDKYYDKYNSYTKKKYEHGDNKIIPRRKLSPIKKKIINVKID